MLLARDDRDAVEQLEAQLAIIGSWAPIVALSVKPPTQRVVSARGNVVFKVLLRRANPLNTVKLNREAKEALIGLHAPGRPCVK